MRKCEKRKKKLPKKVNRQEDGRKSVFFLSENKNEHSFVLGGRAKIYPKIIKKSIDKTNLIFYNIDRKKQKGSEDG